MKSAGKKHRVLFVCLGNICRSPAAEGILREIVDYHGDADSWEIDSAGTYGGHSGQLPDRRMRVHAERRGHHLTHRARRVTEADFSRFDLIIAMDDANYHDLRRLAPTADDAAKVKRMIDFVTVATRYDHIPDPYYEGSEGFELVLDLLENGCENIYTTLSRQKN